MCMVWIFIFFSCRLVYKATTNKNDGYIYIDFKGKKKSTIQFSKPYNVYKRVIEISKSSKKDFHSFHSFMI